jgi:hypothetical protein
MAMEDGREGRHSGGDKSTVIATQSAAVSHKLEQLRALCEVTVFLTDYSLWQEVSVSEGDQRMIPHTQPAICHRCQYITAVIPCNTAHHTTETDCPRTGSGTLSGQREEEVVVAIDESQLSLQAGAGMAERHTHYLHLYVHVHIYILYMY